MEKEYLLVKKNRQQSEYPITDSTTSSSLSLPPPLPRCVYTRNQFERMLAQVRRLSSQHQDVFVFLLMCGVCLLGAVCLEPFVQAPLSTPDNKSQFSVLINGFSKKRMLLLQEIVQNYTRSPLVHKVVLLWGNPDLPAPTVEELLHPINVTAEGRQLLPIPSPGAAAVTVVETHDRSLNQRFVPRPDIIKTRAVFVCDDDIGLSEEDLHFGFRVWQENMNRIVGFFARAHTWSYKSQGWVYDSKPTKGYSIILTKAMFIDHNFFNDYTYRMTHKTRDFVDQHRNCEDILMNFVVSGKTGLGPLMVDGSLRDWGDSRNSEKLFVQVTNCPWTQLYQLFFWFSDVCSLQEAISSTGNHQTERHACINTFAELLGGMHLRNTTYKVVLLPCVFDSTIHLPDRALLQQWRLHTSHLCMAWQILERQSIVKRKGFCFPVRGPWREKRLLPPLQSLRNYRLLPQQIQGHQKSRYLVCPREQRDEDIGLLSACFFRQESAVIIQSHSIKASIPPGL